MLFLAPNVYVLEYLMNTKQISGASAESAHRFIQSGMYSFLSNMRHLVFCQILVSPKGSLSEKSFLYYFLLINKYRSLVCVLFCCKALREAARARKMCRQNRAQSRLLYLFYNKESVKFLKHYFQFSKQTLFPKRTTVSSACSLLLLSKLQEANQNPCWDGSNNLISCTRPKLSKISNHQSSHSAIVYKLNSSTG